MSVLVMNLPIGESVTVDDMLKDDARGSGRLQGHPGLIYYTVQLHALSRDGVA
jgi:hypothetical protein